MGTQMKEEKNTEIKKVTYFYCYNPKLRKFLGLSGLTWVAKDTHFKTKRTYWVFEHSEELNELITKYRKNV